MLGGSATASFSGKIDVVTTTLGECDYDVVDLNTCSKNEFSGTGLPAVNVSAGQIVQVKVTFSFS